MNEYECEGRLIQERIELKASRSHGCSHWAMERLCGETRQRFLVEIPSLRNVFIERGVSVWGAVSGV